MRTSFMAFLLLLLVLFLDPQPGEAQACVGVPIGSGQSGGSVGIGFPDGGNIFGAAFHHDLANSPLSLGVRFEHTNFDARGINSINAFGGTLIYDLRAQITELPEGLSLGLVAGFMYGRWPLFEDRDWGESLTLNMVEIPLGVGFGGTLVLSEGEDAAIELIPYAVPAIYHQRFSAEGESYSETDLDMILGGTLRFSQFFFGLDLQNLFRDGSSYATLRAGLIF